MGPHCIKHTLPVVSDDCGGTGSNGEGRHVSLGPTPGRSVVFLIISPLYGQLSKLTEKKLRESEEFSSACSSAYSESLSQSQHAFSGIPRYQLLPASLRLHSSLSHSSLLRWAPSPPTQPEVDSALRKQTPPVEVLDLAAFKRFAVELYREMVVGGAARAVLLRGIPIGAAGIAGVGAIRGDGAAGVGRAVGVYAVGVAALAAAFLGFS